MPQLKKTDTRVWSLIAVRGGNEEVFVADGEDAILLLAVSLIADATGDVVSPTWSGVSAWLSTGSHVIDMTFTNVGVWSADYNAVEELGHATDMHKRT